MPDRDLEAPPHARLLTALIWAGVGLAPVAALVVLLGGSENSIRFAVLLTAVCVVLIGAALLVRDPALLRGDGEEQAAALREEIAAGTRALGQRVQALQDEMTRMRAAGPPAMAPAAGRAAAAAPVGAGRSAVTSAYVAPPEGHTSVAQIPVVSGSAGRTSRSAAVSPPAGRTSAPAGRTSAPAGRVPASAAVSGAAGRPASAAVPGAMGRIPASAAVSGVAGRPARAAGSASAAVAAASVGAAAVGSSAAWSGGAASDVAGRGAARPGAIGSTAMGSGGVGSGAGGFGAAGAWGTGSASVGAAAAPRQRGPAVVQAVNGGAYQAEHGAVAARAVSDYDLGSSGSAWAERSGAVVRAGQAESARGVPAEPRQSRRHAAPDTGTDIARFGSGDLPQPASQGFDAAEFAQEQRNAAAGFTEGQMYDAAAFGEVQGYDNGGSGEARSYDTSGFGRTQGYDAAGFGAAQGYDAAGFGAAQGYDAAGSGQAEGYGGSTGQAYGAGTDYGLPGGYDQTGEAPWTGHDDGYADPVSRAWPAAGGFGSAASSFFPEEEDSSDLTGGYPPPAGRAVTYGLTTPAPEAGVHSQADRYSSDQYGPDPTAAHDGWAPRSRQQPSRW